MSCNTVIVPLLLLPPTFTTAKMESPSYSYTTYCYADIDATVILLLMLCLCHQCGNYPTGIVHIVKAQNIKVLSCVEPKLTFNAVCVY